MMSLASTRIGERDVPRLSIGDRAFLTRYGRQMDREHAIELLSSVLETTNLGIAAGDESSLEACLAIGSRASERLVYHTPNLLDPTRVDTARALGTIAEHARRLGASSGFERYLGVAPYASVDLHGDLLSRATIDKELQRIERAKPALVTAGSTWFDLLCLLERRDEIAKTLSLLRSTCDRVKSALAVLTYAGPVVLPAGDPFLARVDALVVPVNASAYSMLPTRAHALSWARSFEKPIIGIHLLDRGRISPWRALPDAFDGALVDAAIVGAGTKPQIFELLRAGESVARLRS